jgi:hypothetical protein
VTKDVPGWPLDKKFERGVGEVIIHGGDKPPDINPWINAVKDVRDKIQSIIPDAFITILLSDKLAEFFSEEVVKAYDIKVERDGEDYRPVAIHEFYEMRIRVAEVTPRESMFFYVDNRLVCILHQPTLSLVEFWTNSFTSLPPPTLRM